MIDIASHGLHAYDMAVGSLIEYQVAGALLWK